ncbi:ABC transporter ATP-binding protein [Sporolactobacillus pectinivorans]|uniref:ABC transporter ATP-binding protein n=1 Tax=Sporolactobacillus pectinivorans TaxID=1591408 RepID=UPI000C25EBA4|nr:ABC transporter ATP-binding protein [Sporolactobacillus pectinivorans]
MTEIVVSVRGLVKHYGTFTALNGIDFQIGSGEVFGLLGANGAGKTTTLECLEGLRQPSAGAIRIAGCNPQTDGRTLRRRLGVQLQSAALPGCMRVDEAIALMRAYQHAGSCSDLVERFDAGTLLKKQYRQLSTGQRRRVHLILALIGRPRVLVLDEPTAGLDVQSRAHLHEAVREMKKAGMTILMASHDMAEVEELCDRLAILRNGRIVASGTPEEITAHGNEETLIRLRTSGESLHAGDAVAAATLTGSHDGYLEWRSRNAAASVIELLSRVEAAGDVVEDLRVERPSLEQRFLELVEGGEHE